jgi:CYTH domain-containing protein
MKEIERKWLLIDFPDLPQTGESEISASYLYVGEDIEVRVQKRLKSNIQDDHHYSYKLTIKIGEGLERTEIECKLTEEKYNKLIQLCENTPIHKLYRTFDLNGRKLEVSCVDYSWFYAEIEFKTVAEAESYVLPYDWKEVTGRPEYSMKNYWASTHKII